MANLLAPPFPRITSPFGERPQWRIDMGLGPHRGADFDCDEGDPIPASGVGVCTGRGYDTAIGYWVVVRYPTAFGDIYFGYCHLREDSHLRYSVWVKPGETVGIVGNTGTATTGAHLHLTASWSNGNPAYVAVVDPARFLDFTAATAGADRTPVKTQEETEMPIVSRGGALHFIDELGVDKVADFVSSDMSNAEVVNGLNVVFGNYQDHGLRTFDVVAALAQRRWARKLGEIAAAIAVGVKPDITQAELDLAIKRAIPEGALEFDIDDAAAQKIAEFVQNEQDERERARLDK